MSEEKTREERQAERDERPGKPLLDDVADPADSSPHHALGNPASEPDPTEWPDPYERRHDPRGPEGVDTPASPAEDEPEPPGGQGPSTSEPHPPRNFDDVKPEKGEPAG
jgi:hypothetical protein